MNLIVTCARHLEHDAKHEIIKIFEELGDSEPEIIITDMQGILTISSKIEPLEFVKRITEIIEDEPWAVRYMLRIIPIELTMQTDLEKIASEIPSLISKIKKEETYRISLEKRNSNIASREIITKIANLVPNKVSLENPDWEILVEILGGITGISVLRKSQVISIPKLKRKMSE